MSSFISKSACRGRRPSQFVGYNGYQRQELISRLLKERGVARFIVAPDGYGKTCLAVDYAETIFSWVHVYFVNAQSPCFIRDLDDGAIAAMCKAGDGELRLVVFDDVPALDAYRSEQFSSEIDELLAMGCEVLVTCTPACDVYGTLQRDRLRVSARDMLLNDEEVELARVEVESSGLRDRSALVSSRVAALVWSKAENVAQAFLRNAFKEQVPADLLLAMASIYVVRRGRLGQLSEFGLFDLRQVGDLLESYPHLGFDSEMDSFEAPGIDVADVAAAVKRHIDVIVERSAFAGREELAFAWADSLCQDGSDIGRACEVIEHLCPKPKRAEWLLAHSESLVRLACFLPTLSAVESLGRQVRQIGSARPRIVALEALCRRFLGDVSGALSCAKRCAFDEAAPKGARVVALLLLARFGPETLRESAMKQLRLYADQADFGTGGTSSRYDMLAYAWCVSTQGLEPLIGAWAQLRDGGAEDLVLDLAAVWAFDILSTLSADEGAGYSVDQIELHVRRRLEARDGARSDFFAASAGLAMEEAHAKGAEYRYGPLPTPMLLDLRQLQLHLISQRRRFEQNQEARQNLKSNWTQTHPDAAIKVQEEALFTRAKRSVPVLSIKLFGRFAVSIGNAPVTQDAFRRRNSRTLLVLLAINQGRELSRISAAESLWPKSDPETANKNYYTVWSELKRALSLPDGTCPYLLRHQYGCSLEERYVQSDVARFNEICRELLFGYPDMQKWPELYAELDRDFSSELMPTERKNAAIIEARNEFKTRLVDALVAGSLSIVDSGSPQWGIWFARAGVSHDATREDAYVALMRAQIAADQRTAAIMTYHKCRKTLAEQLGVDPSPETRSLYQWLIDVEGEVGMAR